MRIITSHKFFADTASEWIAKDVPGWFKNAAGSRQELGPPSPTGCPAETFNSSSYRTDSIRLCPSFVDIFKNTLLLRFPTDFIIRYTGEFLMVQLAGGKGFVEHSCHRLKDQMDEEYGTRNAHLKIDMSFMFVSDKPSKLIITSPEYHFDEEVSPLKAMFGVLAILPNEGVPVSINTTISMDLLTEKREVFIKKGTPLAYLYFPEGAPSTVDYVSSDEFLAAHWTRTTFFGDYLKRINKQGLA